MADQSTRDLGTIAGLCNQALGTIITRAIAEENTPRYAGLMKSLPSRERVILFRAICESDEEKVSTQRISEITRIPRGAVSTLLRRLGVRGLVDLVTDEGRPPGYFPDWNNPKKGYKRYTYSAKLRDPDLKAWWIYQIRGNEGLREYVSGILSQL